VARSSSGVVAVGKLTVDGPLPAGSSQGYGPSNALLAAIGAWLVGAEAAVCAVIDPTYPNDLIKEMTRAGIDVSRIRSVSAAEAARGILEPTAEQLASVSPSWAVHLCPMSARFQRDLLRAVSGRVILVTLDVATDAGSLTLDSKTIFGLAAESDAILLGRREVEAVWPGQAPRQVLRLLAHQGARTAVINLGGGAAIALRGDAVTWMPAFPVGDRAHTPGRDAYGGAFAATYAAYGHLARAMAWAAAAESAVVESRSPLELVNNFARRTVESRARRLETEALEP